MSLTVAVSLFFAVAILFIIIIDIYTMLFRITGMSEEKARFQVVSLITNSGFTTKEAEMVLISVSRRKLARHVMLFGFIFSLTVVSVFVNVVLSMPNVAQADFWQISVIVFIIFLAFVLVKKIPKAKILLNSRIEKIGLKLLYKGKDNPVIVLDEYPKGVIAEVTITKVPDALKNISIAQANVRAKHSIHLIFLKRGQDIVEVTPDVVIMQNDKVVAFGTLKSITELFATEKSCIEST